MVSKQIEHLTKEIGNDTILKDVTLSLEKRNNYLEGQNGSGKQCLCERSVASLPYPGICFIENKKLWDDIDFHQVLVCS